MLTEFADSREFIVSGDAVVVDILGDMNYDSSCGGQYLHFIYLCERLMLNFVQKGVSCPDLMLDAMCLIAQIVDVT